MQSVVRGNYLGVEEVLTCRAIHNHDHAFSLQGTQELRNNKFLYFYTRVYIGSTVLSPLIYTPNHSIEIFLFLVRYLEKSSSGEANMLKSRENMCRDEKWNELSLGSISMERDQLVIKSRSG